ncbi:hypothetical protein MAR_031795 [Mya arenaria]|uniref:Uncharacterized protein n=1 Tax=Mya arenaria TaxID=6604 RepID=A0ABY7FD45_MYAAR|nr:hypothetical protein MAR_031795 [Mya arenaria]
MYLYTFKVIYQKRYKMIVIWMYVFALFKLTYCSGQFRYAVRNGVYAPTFNYEQDMDLVGNNTLVYYMNKACDIYPETFTNYVAKYFPGLGYSIESINGQTGNWHQDKTYWQIRNDSGPLPLGDYSATYVPALGYFIDAINGVAGDWDADKSYWRILNFSQPLSVGTAKYGARRNDRSAYQYELGSYLYQPGFYNHEIQCVGHYYDKHTSNDHDYNICGGPEVSVHSTQHDGETLLFTFRPPEDRRQTAADLLHGEGMRQIPEDIQKS